MAPTEPSRGVADTARDEASDLDAQSAARICWHYFKEGQTQEVIAQRLGMTRKRVNRLIAQALATGLVQITIDSRFAPCTELEARLVDKYGLQRAIVVPAPGPDTDVRTVVGAAAGQYVSEHLAPGGSLAIAWGGTIAAAAQNVRRRQDAANSVISLVGGLATSGPVNPYDNAAMMARALGATCSYVTAPMIADSRELREALLKSAPVARVFASVARSDMALLSAVDLTEQSRALEYGVISRATWKSLKAAGSVGDIAGNYLNGTGEATAHPIADLVVRPPLQQVRSIRRLVLAAGGGHKVPLIRAGILAGLCHVLITDESAARSLAK
jgi:DNA-binding transcriptional regulator LsrR (DeoR family)